MGIPAATLLDDRHSVDGLGPSSNGPGRPGPGNREVVTP
jgi:hypothetical protein